MSKIYDLYSPDQRKIDNLKRRIRGYQKMEKDLNRDIRKTNNKNRELQQRIDKALQELDKYRINFDFPGFTDRTIENTRKILRGKDE